MRESRVLVTGGTGFLGRAVCKALRVRGAVVTAIGSADVNLADERLALSYLDARASHYDCVVHCAAACGGIGANMQAPFRMVAQNLRMAVNIVEWCRWRMLPLVAIGSVCAYPKHTPVPFRESDLWSGYPEETNAPYGNAKRMLLELMQAANRERPWPMTYLLPANLYGPGDNFGDGSHVIPAMIRRFMEARDSGVDEVACWGTGTATREFLFVDDAAEAIAMAVERIGQLLVMNLGCGEEITMAVLADEIARVVGYTGRIAWDNSKPDGQPRRALDGTAARERLGWEPQVCLVDGLRRTVEWWNANTDSGVRPATASRATA